MLFNEFIIILKKPCHAFYPPQYALILGNIGELFPRNGYENAVRIKKNPLSMSSLKTDIIIEQITINRFRLPSTSYD